MWAEQDRQIFSFVYKGEMRFADPVKVVRLMLQHTAGLWDRICKDVNRLYPSRPEDDDHPRPAAQPGTPEYAQGQAARGVLAEAALAAFGLPPFDPYTGQGALEDEALTILGEFTAWQKQKKTTGGTTT